MARWFKDNRYYVPTRDEGRKEGVRPNPVEGGGPASGKTKGASGKLDQFGNQGPVPKGDPHVKYSGQGANGNPKLGDGDPFVRGRGVRASQDKRAT